MRKLLIITFYINVAGLTRQQAEQSIVSLSETYNFDSLPDDIKEYYFIEYYWIPITNGDSRVELTYAS